MSLIAVQQRAGLNDAQLRANVKPAISGGQNEPSAIAGILWAILERPTVQKALHAGTLSYLQVFEEFARWISPIGMSPRRIAKPYHYNGVDFVKDARAFLMFSSETTMKHILTIQTNLILARHKQIHTLRAGPHFCAGAWASRSLIVNVALPMILDAFPNMTLNGSVEFSGWAFVASRFGDMARYAEFRLQPALPLTSVRMRLHLNP